MNVDQIPEKTNRRHPLQRLASPSKGFSGALHVAGLLGFYSTFRFLLNNPNAITEAFGWHFQYLTIIGLALSTLSFTSGLIADITNAPTPFLLKNYLSLLATPLSLLISLLYWTLRTISPSLVIPTDLPMLPLTTDLTLHLFPAIVLSIDTLLLSPPWPTSPVNPNAPLITLTLSTGLAFAYWFWIELCFSRNGFYPYPIFALLGVWQRVGLFVVSGVTMWVVGAGLRTLYAYINGYEKLVADGGPWWEEGKKAELKREKKN